MNIEQANAYPLNPMDKQHKRIFTGFSNLIIHNEKRCWDGLDHSFGACTTERQTKTASSPYAFQSEFCFNTEVQACTEKAHFHHDHPTVFDPRVGGEPGRWSVASSLPRVDKDFARGMVVAVRFPSEIWF